MPKQGLSRKSVGPTPPCSTLYSRSPCRSITNRRHLLNVLGDGFPGLPEQVLRASPDRSSKCLWINGDGGDLIQRKDQHLFERVTLKLRVGNLVFQDEHGKPMHQRPHAYSHKVGWPFVQDARSLTCLDEFLIMVGSLVDGLIQR
jgi:hypothetical protein